MMKKSGKEDQSTQTKYSLNKKRNIKIADFSTYFYLSLSLSLYVCVCVCLRLINKFWKFVALKSFYWNLMANTN